MAVSHKEKLDVGQRSGSEEGVWKEERGIKKAEKNILADLWPMVSQEPL